MKWYRYVDWATAAPVDEYGHPIGSSGMHIHCHEYTVVRYTPCGVWLGIAGEKLRWVSKTSRKTFACETKEKALYSFMARKRKQASIYRARAADADRAYVLAEREAGNVALDELELMLLKV